jgi:hypothetical protein
MLFQERKKEIKYSKAALRISHSIPDKPQVWKQQKDHIY